MIEAPEFVIAHLTKTGGDAIKNIVRALKLPNVVITQPKLEKHIPIKDTGGKDFILSFRRLPARAVSLYWHVLTKKSDSMKDEYFPNGTDDIRETLGQCIMRCNNHDHTLACHLQGGKHTPAHVITSENLRRDLLDTLKHYYRFNKEQRQIIFKARTKKRNPYLPNVRIYLTEEEIRQLYLSNPVWTDLERQVYGDLMVEL